MKISKADFNALPETIKKLFKPAVDDAESYTNGEESADKLKTALENERAEKKKVAQERDTLKSAKEEAERKKTEAEENAEAEKLRKSGDIEAIERRMQTKIEEAEKQVAELVKQGEVRDMETAATKATDSIMGLFTSADYRPIVAGRIKSEMKEGKAQIYIIDKNGERSNMDLSGLKKELLTTESLKPILISSKGAGGGATASKGGGGATPSSRSDFADATAEAKFANENPEAYQAMLAAEA